MPDVCYDDMTSHQEVAETVAPQPQAATPAPVATPAQPAAPGAPHASADAYSHLEEEGGELGHVGVGASGLGLVLDTIARGPLSEVLTAKKLALTAQKAAHSAATPALEAGGAGLGAAGGAIDVYEGVNQTANAGADTSKGMGGLLKIGAGGAELAGAGLATLGIETALGPLGASFGLGALFGDFLAPKIFGENPYGMHNPLNGAQLDEKARREALVRAAKSGNQDEVDRMQTELEKRSDAFKRESLMRARAEGNTAEALRLEKDLYKAGAGANNEGCFPANNSTGYTCEFWPDAQPGAAPDGRPTGGSPHNPDHPSNSDSPEYLRAVSEYAAKAQREREARQVQASEPNYTPAPPPEQTSSHE